MTLTPWPIDLWSGAKIIHKIVLSNRLLVWLKVSSQKRPIWPRYEFDLDPLTFMVLTLTPWSTDLWPGAISAKASSRRACMRTRASSNAAGLTSAASSDPVYKGAREHAGMAWRNNRQKNQGQMKVKQARAVMVMGESSGGRFPDRQALSGQW